MLDLETKTEARLHDRTRPARVALIGNFPPRLCGIATFTRDLHDAFRGRGMTGPVIAMDDCGAPYAYPEGVNGLRADDLAAYAAAARDINAARPDIVCVQHEFGIFGGESGAHLLALLDRVQAPVVTTLHTVLSEPNAAQRAVMDRLSRRSARLVVMSERGKRILSETYGVPARKIALIPHGAPQAPPLTSNEAKERFGWQGRDVLLTFGLLSANKGVEHMIRAMPAIAAARPNALYVVLGATHPHVVAREGEAYRERLKLLAAELGVAQHIAFVDRFVDQDLLMQALTACDVYVTPYLHAAQITSGTLAYALALGKAVVSTPYWHAEEALSDGRGVLTPFADSAALSEAVLGLLTDEVRLAEIRARAGIYGRQALWPRCAERYEAVFQAVRAEARKPIAPKPARLLPKPKLDAVFRMSDACGILQHGVYLVPDRRHGYCTDDNARALLLMAQMPNEPGACDRAIAYASFLQHAWNPECGAFRNFMSYDRRWLEEEGSPDSFGRAMQALGVVASGALEPEMARWAKALFETALPAAAKLPAPRSRAFTMLGLARLLEAEPGHARARDVLSAFGSQLCALYERHARTDWRWFEPRLSYDNARLPEALLRAAMTLQNDEMKRVGVEALAWLCSVQTGEDGCFRAVGSETFSLPNHAPPAQFDQQPLEALATIEASAAAFAASSEARWVSEAQRAMDWFLGENDLGVALGDARSGGCYDGLARTGPNYNQGAESVLAFQAALAAMHALIYVARREPREAVAR